MKTASPLLPFSSEDLASGQWCVRPLAEEAPREGDPYESRAGAALESDRQVPVVSLQHQIGVAARVDGWAVPEGTWKEIIFEKKLK